MSALVTEKAARAVTPLGILVEHLEKTVKIMQQTNLPAELAASIQKAYSLAAGIDPYLIECSTTESEALSALAQKTVTEDWSKRFSDGETVRQLEQEMLSGHVEGQILKMFVHMCKAKRLLEIGMFTGYSALAMAEALPDDWYLVACEVDPYVANFARECFKPIKVNRREERQRLGLEPDLPTGLVMFGGYGSTLMWQIANRLQRSPLKNLQLIFLCGRNEKVARMLRRSQSRFPMFVETFTSEVPYYMYLSDFFIGKPGPGNISEALAMKLPVITECNASTLLQERSNAQWLAENGFGIVIPSLRYIDRAVAELIQPENLSRYQNRIATLKNKAVFEFRSQIPKLGMEEQAID